MRVRALPARQRSTAVLCGPRRAFRACPAALNDPFTRLKQFEHAPPSASPQTLKYARFEDGVFSSTYVRHQSARESA
jgi:hypothetical protein